MKKFDNKELKEPSADGKMTRYIDVLLVAVNTPGERGFTPQQNFEATKLYRKISEFTEDTEIQIEDADFNSLKEAFNRLSILKRSDELFELYEYMQSIK